MKASPVLWIAFVLFSSYLTVKALANSVQGKMYGISNQFQLQEIDVKTGERYSLWFLPPKLLLNQGVSTIDSAAEIYYFITLNYTTIPDTVELIGLNLTTGHLISVVQLPWVMEGSFNCRVDPRQGDVIVASTHNKSHVIYRVTPSTGNVMLVCSTVTENFPYGGIEVIDSVNNLVWVEYMMPDRTFFAFDLTTGETRHRTLNFNYMENAVFDPVSGLVWGIAYGFKIMTLNSVTGAFQVVGELPGNYTGLGPNMVTFDMQNHIFYSYCNVNASLPVYLVGFNIVTLSIVSQILSCQPFLCGWSLDFCNIQQDLKALEQLIHK